MQSSPNQNRNSGISSPVNVPVVGHGPSTTSTSLSPSHGASSGTVNSPSSSPRMSSAAAAAAGGGGGGGGRGGQRVGSLDIHTASHLFNTNNRGGVNRFSSRSTGLDFSLDLTTSSGGGCSTVSSDFHTSYSLSHNESTSSFGGASTCASASASMCSAANSMSGASNITGTSSSKWGNLSVKFSAKNFCKQQNKQTPFEGVYQLGELLGEGGYGEVYRCCHMESGLERAVKVVFKDPTLPLEERDNQAKEFHILKECDHPNLLHMYELFEDELSFYIVTDIITGGELYDELELCGNFTEEDTQILMNVLLSCINYCHQQGLVHKDLKPENILLEATKDFHSLKIIDFGLAQQLAPPVSPPHYLQPKFTDIVDDHNSTFEGSKYYLAPECIQGMPTTTKSDIWAIGVIAFVMLGGYAPFDGDTDEQVHRAIVQGYFDFSEETWDDVSEDAKDFVRMLLTYDADARPTAETMLQHPWLAPVRNDTRNEQQRRASTRASLTDLQSFHSADSKLKQATCAIIASQFLSNHEKEEIDEIFRSLDTSGKGTLTLEDLRRAYQDFFPNDDEDGEEGECDADTTSSSSSSSKPQIKSCTISDEQIQELIRQVNFSGSGSISYSEFTVATMMEKNLIDDDKLRAAFAYFDKEGTGVITAQNLKDALHIDDSHGSAADAYVTKKIIGQVSQSGVIEFEDFKNMMSSRTVKRLSIRRSSRFRQSIISKQALQELVEGMDESEVSLDGSYQSQSSSSQQRRFRDCHGSMVGTGSNRVGNARSSLAEPVPEASEEDESETQEEDLEEEEEEDLEDEEEEEDLFEEEVDRLASLRASLTSNPSFSTRRRKARRCSGMDHEGDDPRANPATHNDAVLCVTTTCTH
ncbi:MAP kinase-activated protein kinase 2 (Fragment) [Seminavis robusta]|uniref:non-specific serine/threonine protein kinase n=1 Tax=Seminavis robusta TaxID=568900 RepID=A0A9N8DHZ4_9STRA